MCRDNPCLLCRFFGADGGTRCNKKEPFLKVLAVCFCGRHAGDQGSERTDWAGLEPPLSPGILLFNHSAAKQSDGELHMPLVSLVSLPLLLSPSSSLSLSFTLFSLFLSPLCSPSPPPLLSYSSARTLYLLIFSVAPRGFCCKISNCSAHAFFNIAAQGEYIAPERC